MNQGTDHLTLEQLVAQREWVRRLARTMVRDDAAADDLVQDAFVTALASPPRRDGWRAWMTQVLRNRSRNVHRGESRRAVRESASHGAVHERATADVVAEADAHRHVVDAVMELDEPLRTTVLLRYFEDLSVEDVAHRTESPLETTRSRLSRAREILRSRLDREHGGREAWCLPLLFTAPPSPDATGRAARPRVPGSALATLVGGLIVNKSIALAVLVLVVAGAWYGLRPAGDAPTAVPSPGPGESTAQRSVPARSRARADADATAETASGESLKGVSSDAAGHERSRDGTPLRRITGRVESSDGVPVGDARVVWVRPAVTAEVSAAAAGAAPSAAAQPSAPPPAAASDPAAWVAVKSDGTFALNVPESQQPIALLAIASGFAPRREPVAPDVQEVVLRLRHAVTLRVRLLGREGRPEAGRWIDVRDEVGSGDSIGRANTDADGFAQFQGLPGGTLVSVRTSGEGRIGGIQQRVLLADAGESVLELRDDGVRRLRVNAVVEGPAVPVSGLLVETSSGPGEIRAWPGGATATIEIPAGAVALSLVTAAGRGEAVSVSPDADEVALSVRLPNVRWIEVEIGNLDPRTMSIAGGRDASELFHAGDLTPFLSGGRLRLPLVEGAEYALRRPDGTQRLLGAFTEGRVVLSDPPPRVQVRVMSAAGSALPAGARVVANPVLRAVRMAGEEASGETTTGGDITLALIPGVTYGMLVTAPGVVAARVEVRAPAEGGEVRVELRAGGPLRLRVSGIEAGSKTSVVTFPGFARLTARVEDGAVVVDGAGDGWALLMAGGAAYLVRAGDGAGKRSAPIVAGFAPEARGNGAGVARTFLIGLGPIADGVHAVGLVGVPFPIPAGRYLPVEWREGEIAVYAPIDLGAASRAWDRPTDADVTWTEGTIEGGKPADLVIDTPEGAIPLGRLVPGRTARWRSAAAGVRAEPGR
ncbi:MAG: RNA polymerase sigma factor [Planctomycetes bacterium]|nr:RNA polymerase sigma factor [Planctomycetota bacterium]